MCREVLSIRDSDIGSQRRKSLDFTSNEVVRGSGSSMLEDRWQGSNHFVYQGFVSSELKGQTLGVMKSRVARLQ
jgi:hypothetical protein